METEAQNQLLQGKLTHLESAKTNTRNLAQTEESNQVETKSGTKKNLKLKKQTKIKFGLDMTPNKPISLVERLSIDPAPSKKQKKKAKPILHDFDESQSSPRKKNNFLSQNPANSKDEHEHSETKSTKLYSMDDFLRDLQLTTDYEANGTYGNFEEFKNSETWENLRSRLRGLRINERFIIDNDAEWVLDQNSAKVKKIDQNFFKNQSAVKQIQSRVKMEIDKEAQEKTERQHIRMIKIKEQGFGSELEEVSEEADESEGEEETNELNDED